MDGMKLLNVDSFPEIVKQTNTDDDSLSLHSPPTELSPELSIESDKVTLQNDFRCASTNILNITSITEAKNDSSLLAFQKEEFDLIDKQTELKTASTVATKVDELDNNKLKQLSMNLNTEADCNNDCNLIEQEFDDIENSRREPSNDISLHLHLNDQLATAESNFREQEAMNEKNIERIDKLTIQNIELQHLLKKNTDERQNGYSKIDTEGESISILQNDEQLSLITLLDNEIKKNEILEIENTRLRNDREKDLEFVDSTLLVRTEYLEEKNTLLIERQDFFTEQNSFFFEKQDLLEEVFRLKSELKVLGLEDTANGLIEKDIILEEIKSMKLGRNRSEKKFKEILHINETNISQFENTISALEMLKFAMENRIDQLEDEKTKEVEKHELLVEGLLKAAGLHHKIDNEENDDSNYLVHLFMKQLDEERLKVNALKSCLMQFGSQLSGDDNKILLNSGIILIPNGGETPLDSPPIPAPVPSTLSSRFRWNKGEKKDINNENILDNDMIPTTKETIPLIPPLDSSISIPTRKNSRFRWTLGRRDTDIVESKIDTPIVESETDTDTHISELDINDTKKIDIPIDDSNPDIVTF
jgi:hypothetical protein